MAQHIEIENFKDESWYKDVFGEITKALDKKIGKKGKYFSIMDKQCDGEIMHTGRNSKSKEECAEDSMFFFDDNYICACGIEGWEYEDDKCEECGEKCSDYMDRQVEFAQKDPDGYVQSFEAEIIEHEYKIYDSDDAEMEDMNIPMENGLKAQQGLTMFPDDRVEGAKAFGYHSKNKSRLADDDDLRVCDIGFEIHIGKESAIYLVA